MGSKNSHCCLCKNNSLANKDFIINYAKEKNTPIILIQSTFRGFLYRKSHPEFIRNMNLKLLHTTSSQDLSKQIKQVGLDYNTDVFENNQKLESIKKLLPKFKLEEKEAYQLTVSNLKTTCLLYPDNSVYKGTINDKWQREGYGKFYLPDGSIYEGFFKENKMQGRGRLMNIEGFVYEGDFSNSQAKGYGKYVNVDGTVYKGSWAQDKQNGIGEETYKDNSKYIGNFVNGKKHGKGKFIFPEGNSFEGDFDNNEIKGEGIFKWKDGRVYIGEWSGNKMNGYGLFSWPDKKKYIGSYVNNNKEGFGGFYWSDGKKFEGFWKEGKQHGYGYTELGGKREFGEWFEGRKVKNFQNDDQGQIECLKLIEDIKNEENYKKFEEKLEKYEKDIER